jgi:hypothetical protein
VKLGAGQRKRLALANPDGIGGTVVIPNSFDEGKTEEVLSKLPTGTRTVRMTVKRAQNLHAEGRKPDSEALSGRITASDHQALENAEKAPRRSSDDRTEPLTNPKASKKAKPMTKAEVCKELAANTDLEPRQVAAFFAALKKLIQQQLSNKGPGLFVIPNLVMFKLVKKAVTEARFVPNPFKPGEMLKIKGKPASVQVKLVLLKVLRDLEGGK